MLKLEDGGICDPEETGWLWEGKRRRVRKRRQRGTASRRQAKEPTIAQRRRGDLCRIGGAAVKE